MKKRIGIILSLVLLVCAVFPLLSITTNAATITETEFQSKIASLKSEYPHGKYWSNNNGTVQSGIYKGTSLAGTSSCKYVNCGTMTLNGYEYGWQCHGYALLLAHKIFGSIPNNSPSYWDTYTDKNHEISQRIPLYIFPFF